MSDQYLKEAAKIMEQFRQQQMGGNQMSPPVQTNEFDNQGGGFGTYGDGNDIGMGFDNQGSNQFKPTMAPPRPKVQSSVIAPASQPVGVSGACPECGTLHPPLRPGEKCPNAGIGDSLKSSGLDDTIINKHLSDLRNIIMSNISSKGVKDGRKFFQHLIISVTKSMENYSE